MKRLLLSSLACLFIQTFAFAGFTKVTNSETIITAPVEGNWGEVVENLRDDNQETKYTCFFSSADGTYIQYELGTSAILYKYTIRTANDSPGRDPMTWALLGSVDGADWTVIDERPNEFFSGRFHTNEYVVKGNNTAFKYYRLFVSAIVGSDQLSFADWDLYTKDDSKLAPSSLKLSGSALAESSGEIALGWKTGYYELYTSLKAGGLSFVGDAALAGTTIAGDEAVYRIRVDYRTNTPEISVQKIELMDLWTPWNKFVIGELEYAGNSTFKVGQLLCNLSDWGDDRYRVRIFFEGDIKETYGARSSSSEYLTLTHNDEWGTVGDLNEWNCHLPIQYTNGEKPFNVEIAFDANSVYTAKVSDYIPDAMPDALSIQGSALVESQGAANVMKLDGTVFELYTALSSGTYSFVGDDNLEASTVEVEGESVPYRIRVNYATETPTVSFDRIESIFMWVPWSQNVVGEFTYTGGSKFIAEGIICDTREWTGEENENEDRYRIRIETADGNFETYAPKDGENFVLVGNSTWGSSDFNYTVDAKYKNTGVPFDAVLRLSATDGYFYVITDQGASIDSDKEESNVNVYPTVVSDNVNIVLGNAGFDVDIISLTGKTIQHNTTDIETLSISTSNIPSGIYFVKIIQNKQLVAVKRIIKL